MGECCLYVIDPDGRIFGKINIVDFLVVVVIVLAAFLAFKFFVASDKAWVEVGVTLENQPQWVVDAVKEGDTGYDEFGSLNLEVLGTSSTLTKPASATTLAQYKLEMLFRIKAEKRGNDFYFKNKKVKVKSKITPETTRFFLEDVIVTSMRPE